MKSFQFCLFCTHFGSEFPKKEIARYFKFWCAMMPSTVSKIARWERVTICACRISVDENWFYDDGKPPSPFINCLKYQFHLWFYCLGKFFKKNEHAGFYCCFGAFEVFGEFDTEPYSRFNAVFRILMSPFLSRCKNEWFIVPFYWFIVVFCYEAVGEGIPAKSLIKGFSLDTILHSPLPQLDIYLDSWHILWFFHWFSDENPKRNFRCIIGYGFL